MARKIEVDATSNMDKQMKARKTNWQPVKTQGLFIMDKYPLSDTPVKTAELDSIKSAGLDSLMKLSDARIEMNSDAMSIDDDIEENIPTDRIISLINAVIMDMDNYCSTYKSKPKEVVISGFSNLLNSGPITFRDFTQYDEMGWKNRTMCFSLTYPGVIRVGGITYTSLYHYIVARKARLYSYFGIYKAISKMTHSPCYPDEEWFEHENRIKNYDAAMNTDYLWDLHSNEVLRCGLHAKFTQINGYRRILDETGNNKLIYVNDDPYLGAKVIDGVVVGQNRLGEMLMNLREKLRRM